MHPSSHWFVPLNELDADTGAPLRPADMAPTDNESLAQNGDSFLMTLESLLIVQQYDRRSDNDLLVRSRLKYGNDAIVETINFFENDVPAGTVSTNLLCEYIYTQEHYAKLNRVHLEVEVMELPGDISRDQTIATGLNLIKNTFGVVLSAFLPFGGVAFDVMKKINTVRSEKRRIFFSNLDLYGDGGEGEARLRYGAYIFFQKPVDGSLYKLHKLQVQHLAAEDAAQTCPHDYSVIKVVPTAIRVGSNEELTLNNQKLAAALGTPQGQPDHTPYPDFKQITPDAEQLRNLARFYSLKARKDTQETLDADQTQLYQQLRQKLQDFI